MSDILLKDESGEKTILKSKSFEQKKLLQDALEEDPSLLLLEDHVDGVKMTLV